MVISHWDAAIHYGVQLAQYCDQTRSFNAISLRSPPVYSLARRLRNTKVPVWTHGSIGYPKMNFSHWDAAIHYGVQLAQYCDQTRSFNAILRSPPLETQEHQSTCVNSWVHRVPSSAIGTRQFTMAFSFNIVIKPAHAISLRYPLCTPLKTQEHQSTCVDSWVHRVPENELQPLGRGNSLWRSACPIL